MANDIKAAKVSKRSLGGTELDANVIIAQYLECSALTQKNLKSVFDEAIRTVRECYSFCRLRLGGSAAHKALQSTLIDERARRRRAADVLSCKTANHFNCLWPFFLAYVMERQGSEHCIRRLSRISFLPFQ